MHTIPFYEFGLSTPVMQAIDDLGYEEATPIQTQAIPLLMSGRDVIGQSQTGADVLLNSHCWKQGVVLEHVADLSLLRFQIDPLRRVEQDAIINQNPTAVRFLNACDAFERHAFATS